MINVVLYESSSFGGCYEYVKYLTEAYSKHSDIASLSVVLPRNAQYKIREAKNILADDTPGQGKLNFLFRNFYNPFRLFFFLLSHPKSFVLLNDFEQLTAPFWAPFYHLFLRKHIFAVFLHDPDRDNYPPSRSFSVYCMKKMMNVMDFALFHECLPDKEYYRSNKLKKIAVPCGIFTKAIMDETLLQQLKVNKMKEEIYVSIIGNIRKEKNYQLAITALKSFSHVKLIIAGAPANSGETVTNYKETARELGVENKVIWIEKFLTDEEMAAVIQSSDVILLNYSKSFVSQSGILNLIAPYKKEVIISKGESSLYKVAQKFNLGQAVEPDNLNSLVEAIENFSKKEIKTDWDKYLLYASWESQVDIVVNELKQSNLI